MADRWRTVWITGASSGIGLALARELNNQIENVALTARSNGKLEEVAKESDAFRSYPADVTDADAMAACVEKIAQECGPIDLAVLNAGTWKMMPVHQLDMTAVRNSVDVNYFGVLNGINAVLPSMLARGSGHIAIVASVAGYRGLPKAAAYGPTKAALINLAETLRCELEPRGIVISIVNPGFVDTPMTEVNDFPMPGIIPVKQAAEALLRGLKRQNYEVVFPWRFVMGIKLLRLLPNFLFFWFVRNFIQRSK